MRARAQKRSKKVTPRKAGIVRWLVWPIFMLGMATSIHIGWTGKVPDISGQASAMFVDFSTRSGLVLSRLKVSGNERTDVSDIREALPLGMGDPIFGFSLEVAQAQVSSLPWIKSARIARQFPDTLVVELKERKAFAIWQVDGRHELIDERGQVIPGQHIEAFSDLPLVVGADAASDCAELFAILDGEPEYADLVKAAIRVGGRRWDIELKNGVRVSLPGGNEAYSSVMAWSRFATLARDEDILDKGVTRIDLRLPDQVVLALSPEAQKQLSSNGQRT